MLVKSKNLIKSVLLSGVASVLLAPAAFAQAQEGADQAGDDEGGLNVIVVTATKRSASQQDIPISIQTTSAEDLQKLSIKDLSDLAASIPNLQIGEGLTTDAINIRGMGSGPDRSFEQSVGMFIDGVYMPRSRQYRSPFFDVERVEVLRGPQAVYFGLNATAGAVSISTKKNRPGDDLDGRISAEYDLSHDGIFIEGAVGGSIADTLAVRVAGKFRDTRGHHRSSTTGLRLGDIDETLVRVSAVWEPTTSVTITAKYEHVDYRRHGGILESIAPIVSGFGDDLTPNHVTSASPAFLDLLAQNTGENPGEYFSDITNDNVVLSAEVEIGDHTWSTTGSYSTFDFVATDDTDAVALNVLHSSTVEKYDQYSIETRLSSPEDSRFKYMVGGYFQDASLFGLNDNIVGRTTLFNLLGVTNQFLGFETAFMVPPGTLVPVDGILQEQRVLSQFDQDQTTWSLFFDASFDITDELTVAGGVRYVNEKKNHSRNVLNAFIQADGTERVGAFAPGIPGVAPHLQDVPAFTATLGGVMFRRKSDNFLPEVRIQYDTGDVLFYAKYGRSAKAGGFSASTIVDASRFQYGDETADGFEIGAKAAIGNTAELNVAIFHTKFRDLQLNSFDPVTAQSGVGNAGSARSQGIEASVRWAPTDWLNIDAGIAYLDGEFTDFQFSPCYNNEPDPDADGICDHTGFDLPNAPTWTGNIGFDVDVPVSQSFNLLASARTSFTSSHLTESTSDPAARQSGYAKVDARIGLAHESGFELALVGRNLTNKKTVTQLTPFLFTYFGVVSPPRTFWLQASFDF